MMVAGKLTALIGLPVTLIFSIYAGGVYLGAVKADRVVELEQRWLGVAPPPGRLVDGSASSEPSLAEPVPSPDAPAQPTGDTPTGDQPTPDQPKPDQPVQPTPPTGDQPTPPTGDRPTGDQPKPDHPTGDQPTPDQPAPISSAHAIPTVEAAPVGPELRSRFEEAKLVRVDLLVDPALVAARPDWFLYVGSLFEATQVSFARLYGIELQLHGVVVWDAAAEADLVTLERELGSRTGSADAADVTLGLVASPPPKSYSPHSWLGEETGNHALVFAELATRGAPDRDRYALALLRELSRLFGAEPTSDPAWASSFMAAGANADAPTLDPENRGKVIINKRRPIASAEASNPDAPESGEKEPI